MFRAHWVINFAHATRRMIGHCKSIVKSPSKYFQVGGLMISGLGIANCSPVEEKTRKDIALYRPNNGYVRIDGKLKMIHPDVLSNNAFHGSLNGESLIEEYEVYFNPTNKDIVCLVRFGKSLNGHSGVVHGGITALTFDNSFGWLFLANETAPAFTANLNINYRKKVPENSIAMLRCKFSKVEGRKLFMAGTMEDVDGNILADSTCLYIEVRNPAEYSGGLVSGKGAS